MLDSLVPRAVVDALAGGAGRGPKANQERRPRVPLIKKRTLRNGNPIKPQVLDRIQTSDL
jgi:hypothetical protein